MTTLNEYQAWQRDTVARAIATRPWEERVMYCTLGLCGEAGEVAEKVKKMMRDHLSHDEVRIPLRFELGDVLWYLSRLADEFNITLQEVLEFNVDKLTIRMETNTIHGEGDNR